ncbi:hypothetical protein SM007_39505 [Streptomyces avermitilis]|nr:hypothetical protein SM007_39505 [Streptomyces avermitilis]
MGRIVDGTDDECDEQALDLVAGQRQQPIGCGPTGMFLDADGDEEGVGEHRKGGPAGPGGIAADLVSSSPASPFPALEGLLHPPSGSGNPHQLGQRHRFG